MKLSNTTITANDINGAWFNIKATFIIDEIERVIKLAYTIYFDYTLD